MGSPSPEKVKKKNKSLLPKGVFAYGPSNGLQAKRHGHQGSGGAGQWVKSGTKKACPGGMVSWCLRSFFFRWLIVACLAHR